MESGRASISKVTVEYHDPSGVFPLVSRQLEARLPLRDLHWKSPTRPLRSIEFLHVDLVPSKDVRPSTPQSRQGTPALGQDEASASVVPGARRHQIPGLRQTPYLKIYLLRCDDSETYKTTSRKLVREWLKNHTPPSQSSSSKSAQENHDAFEWLILHVVVPNTAAASQPRSSGSSSKNEGVSAEKPGNSSRLLSRSSNTILEKLKADFNVSSKSAPDRISQIRVQSEEPPPNVIPPKSVSSPADYEEGNAERAIAWHDLIVKLKSLILTSFNLRVSQYEEDIRERNAQSALPGWNFCTFFVLKEGLARGFESVGLVDDALVGYDELSLGLDHAIQDHQTGESNSRSDSFLAYTEELKRILVESYADDGLEHIVWDAGAKVISPFRKSYGEMILTTSISVFDFQCYIFARQMTILLRMGILHSSELASLRQDNTSITAPRQVADAEADDLAPLSELCQRASSFIASISRIMRDDLQHAAESQKIQSAEALIDNIVSSWAFAVADQVLEETNSSLLSQVNCQPPQKSAIESFPHPARSSSLSHRGSTSQVVENPETVLDQVREKILSNSSTDQPAPKTTDLENLAGNRADIFMLQRQILERTAGSRGWSTGLSKLRADASTKSSEMKEVDLSDGSETTDSESSPTDIAPSSQALRGVCQASILSAVSSIDTFKTLYEELTSSSLTHYLTAIRKNAIERLVADLALIKFEAGDYVAAAAYLNRVAPSYTERRWGLIEASLSRVHAECLKKLNRKDDYVQMLLNLLARSAARQKSFLELRMRKRPFTNTNEPWLDDDHIDIESSLGELINYSQELPYERSVAMERYFSDISIEPYVQHFDDKDGFSLRLKLRHLLDESLKINRTVLRLKMAEDGSSREVSLENEDALVLKTGFNTIQVHANVTILGTFTVDKITLTANKINFEFDPNSKMEKVSMLTLPDEDTHKSKISARMPRILLYPRAEGLDVKTGLSPDIHIDKRRILEVECSTGWNQVDRAEMHLRSATAGLRLRTADATLTHGEAKLGKAKVPGVIEFSGVPENSKITICIPYDLEDSLRKISIALDVTYHTPKGRFEYLSNPSISTELSLDVNVHDVFKSSFLVSTFKIRASKGVPLQVLDIKLEDTDQFSIQSPAAQITPVLVFPKQEAQVFYKIKRKNADNGRQTAAEEKSLVLTVKYLCVYESAIATAEIQFAVALSHTNFNALSKLLTLTLSEALRRLNPGFFTEVALLCELRIPDFDSIGWESILDGLPPKISNELELWLRKWHEEGSVIVLPLHEVTTSFSNIAHRSITIAVPLPRLQILHTISLSLPNTTNSLFSTGTLIPATVTVSHTRQWDTPFSDAPLEFVYDIDAPAETWLVGGQRRTKFMAKEGEVRTWTIMLMPLKSGKLLLPSMEARLADKASSDLTCDSFYGSSAQTVVVISDVGSTTIGLSDSMSGSDPILISSERRAIYS